MKSVKSAVIVQGGEAPSLAEGMAAKEWIRAAWIVTKPRISLMLVLVGLGSMLVAERGWPGWFPVLAFALTGGLAAGGAAAWNHVLDRDIDRLMKRTRNRPLAQDKVPPFAVAAYGTTLLAVGVALGDGWFGPAVARLLLSGALVYVVIYTVWLKRRTAWNIVIGGAAGSYMALAGWYAIEPRLNLANLVLATFLFLWTPSHFWPLAVACEQDYRRAGVPMLPITAGHKVAFWAVAVNTGVMVLLSLVPLWLLQLHGAYALAVGIPGLALLYANLRMGTHGDPLWAYRSFKWSGPYLAWFILMLALFSI